MIAFGSLLLVLTLSMLIIRIASVMLEFTGLSPDVAHFQARSAFSATGFTTRESEFVTDHPVRRKIVSWLMTLGSIGVPATLATMVVSIMRSQDEATGLLWLLVTVVIFLTMLWVAKARWIDRALHRVIRAALLRWTKLEVTDYQSLLEIQRGYRIAQVRVRPGTWLAQGATLRELRLAQSGVLVFGIHRGEEYIGAPQADLVIAAEDELLCYGNAEILNEIAEREAGPTGDDAHFAAIQRHVEHQAHESMIIERSSLRARER